MMISLLSNSLMGGHTLPAQLPRLRDRLVYHEYHSGGRFLNTILYNSSTSRGSALDSASKAHQENDVRRDGTHEDTEHAAGPSHVDGSNIGLEPDQLTLDVLFVSGSSPTNCPDNCWRRLGCFFRTNNCLFTPPVQVHFSNEKGPTLTVRHSTAIVAFSSLVTVWFPLPFHFASIINFCKQRIDEMADIVRTLCGEATFQGYEALQQDYLDREEKCIGTPAWSIYPSLVPEFYSTCIKSEEYI